jgi:4-hydroxyphenylpyruvate dioxygenase-like putative hemolysin
MAAKPLFTKILQIGHVVKNCDEAVKKWADDYGIGPWKIYEFNPNTVSDMIIRGKKEDYAMRLALCDNLGGVQYELIEPRDDKSLYAEFLKEHGEGVHHIAFDTENYEETVKFYEDKGLPVFQGGTWGKMTYTYLDSQKDLGLVAEIYKLQPDFEWPEPVAVYPPQED